MWTIGDKLRKARVDAGLEQAELATEIGISRNTVRNYEAEKTTPRRPVLLAWAMRTGVSLEWLTQDERPGPDGDAGWAPRGSNPQPADYKGASSRPVLTLRRDAAVTPLLPRRHRDVVPSAPRKAAA